MGVFWDHQTEEDRYTRRASGRDTLLDLLHVENIVLCIVLGAHYEIGLYCLRVCCVHVRRPTLCACLDWCPGVQHEVRVCPVQLGVYMCMYQQRVHPLWILAIQISASLY